jgi:predicted DNA-binding transcriptional regulator AlpA
MSETINTVRAAAAVADANLSTAAATPTRRLISAQQVGELLGCSWRSVIRLADAGKMPAGLKIGALRRWDVRCVEEWIAGGCKPVRRIGG